VVGRVRNRSRPAPLGGVCTYTGAADLATTRNGTVGGLRTELISNALGLEELRDGWEALVGQAPGDSVFATPAWVLTWYRHFAAADTVRAVAVRDGDDLVALAPFSAYRVGHPALGYELWTTAGAEHGYYGEPLLGPFPEAAARAIAGRLADRVAAGTVAVNLRRLWFEGAMHRALVDHPHLDCRPMALPADSAVVRFDREPDPERYLRRLAKKHGVPRRARRLEERFDEVTYVPDDPDIEGALADMRRMLEQRWEPGTGPGLFTGAGRARFTRAVVPALAADGHLRVSSLQADGRRVALSVVFQVGDGVVSEYAAFDADPELARLGVGQRELYEVVSHAHRSGLAAVDLSAVKDYDYKLRWANAIYTSQSVSVTATGWRGRLARTVRRPAMSRHARRIRRWATEHPS
jgi:CelD/BcsL family acetyltransferase involved in cellulose biosynthesis